MPRGSIPGPCPPNHCLCPPNQDCAPKIVTSSEPLEYSSRSETPKILTINPGSVSKDQFFADSRVKTFFLSLLSNSGKQTFGVPQKLFMPSPPTPSHATLAPSLSGKTLSICYNLHATRDVRSGEAGEAVPHLKNCTKKNKNKSIQLK